MMIAKLTGKLDSQDSTSLVLDVNGVGYALSCSRTTLGALPALGQTCILFVDPLIRSEQITLFGFLTEQERFFFRTLLTVQGVGGKVCLALLSALTPSEIERSIFSQDHVPLTKAEGVGPKLAQRIVRELKDKMSTGCSVQISYPSRGPVSQIQQEAVSALTNLGYKKQEALDVVYKILQESDMDLSLTKLVPLALKQLTRA